MYNHIYNVSFFLSTGHPQILYHSDVYRSLPMGPLIANTTYNPQSYSTSSTPNSTRYQQPLSHLSGGPASFQYVASPQSSYPSYITSSSTPCHRALWPVHSCAGSTGIFIVTTAHVDWRCRWYHYRSGDRTQPSY